MLRADFVTFFLNAFPTTLLITLPTILSFFLSVFLSMELPSLASAIRQALVLNESIYVAVQQSPQGLWMALIVVGLAGLSQSLGQSLVLFINHVRPRRFILAVIAAIVGYMSGYALWVASVWLVGSYAFGANVSWMAVAAAVGLAYAPQLLAFFELTPFLGSPFGVLLSLWTLLAIVIGVRAGLGLETWQAVVASGLGWLLLQLWRHTLGAPVYALGHWIEQRAAGVPLRYGAADVVRLRRQPRWSKNVEQWRTRRSGSHAENVNVDNAKISSVHMPDEDGIV
jgi:hypothetical protein